MTNEQQVARWLQQHAEAIVQSSEDITPGVASAAESIVRALVNERKILACGSDSAAHIAQLFVTSLINQAQRERPGLPAISLDNHTATLLGIAQDYGSSEVYARQLQALGHAGDIFVFFAANEVTQAMNNAIQTAHQRGMTVIGFTATHSSSISALLYADDLEICAQTPLRNRALHIQLLSTFCLLELVENIMFGEME
jgi:D-sedoheptulose 7-phosphate isomerase